MCINIHFNVKNIEKVPTELKEYGIDKHLNNFSFHNEFCHLKENIRYYAEKNVDNKQSSYDECGYDGKYRNIVYSDRAFANDILVKLRVYYFNNKNDLWRNTLENCQKIYDYIKGTKTLYVTAYVCGKETLYSNFDYFLMDEIFNGFIYEDIQPKYIPVNDGYYLIKNYNMAKMLSFQPYQSEVCRELYNEAIISGAPNDILGTSRAMKSFRTLNGLVKEFCERHNYSNKFFQHWHINLQDFIEEIRRGKDQLGHEIVRTIDRINNAESFDFAMDFRKVEFYRQFYDFIDSNTQNDSESE